MTTAVQQLDAWFHLSLPLVIYYESSDIAVPQSGVLPFLSLFWPYLHVTYGQNIIQYRGTQFGMGIYLFLKTSRIQSQISTTLQMLKVWWTELAHDDGWAFHGVLPCLYIILVMTVGLINASEHHSILMTSVKAVCAFFKAKMGCISC